jgi:hypothetical protein
MYRIIHKRGSRQQEQHVYSKSNMLNVLGLAALRGIKDNREFIFLPDVGASQPHLRFHDGEEFIVVKMEAKA